MAVCNQAISGCCMPRLDIRAEPLLIIQALLEQPHIQPYVIICLQLLFEHCFSTLPAQMIAVVALQAYGQVMMLVEDSQPLCSMAYCQTVQHSSPCTARSLHAKDGCDTGTGQVQVQGTPGLQVMYTDHLQSEAVPGFTTWHACQSAQLTVPAYQARCLPATTVLDVLTQPLSIILAGSCHSWVCTVVSSHSLLHLEHLSSTCLGQFLLNLPAAVINLLWCQRHTHASSTDDC